MSRWLRWTLQLASVIVLGVVFWYAGPEAWQQIVTGNPKELVISCALVGIGSTASAIRIQLLARSMTDRPVASWARFYHLNMTTRALGLIAPRALSLLAGKPMGLRVFGIPLKRAVWIVIVDNAFDLCLLGVQIVPALIFLKRGGSPLVLLALVSTSILILVVLIRWLSVRNRALWLTKWLSQRPRLLSVLHLDPDVSGGSLPQIAAMQALAFTILLNSALALSYYHVARAVDLTHPWSVFVAAYPISQLSLVLALSPGGLGVFDLSWYGVLSLGGLPQQEALTFVVAQRAYMLVFVLFWTGVSVLLSIMEGKFRRV